MAGGRGSLAGGLGPHRVAAAEPSHSTAGPKGRPGGPPPRGLQGPGLRRPDPGPGGSLLSAVCGATREHGPRPVATAAGNVAENPSCRLQPWQVGTAMHQHPHPGQKSGRWLSPRAFAGAGLRPGALPLLSWASLKPLQAAMPDAHPRGISVCPYGMREPCGQVC